MQWIKLPLVIAAVLILVMVFRNRQRVELRAGSRIAALALGAVAVVSIINPDIPQTLANALGVARGTDLLLYLLIVVFVLTTLGLYFRLRETDHHLRQLVRSIAIEDAIRKDGPPRPGAATGKDDHPGQTGTGRHPGSAGQARPSR